MPCKYIKVDSCKSYNGRFIYLCECDNCGKWLTDYLAEKYNFCPQCGEEIEKEEESESNHM